MSIQSLKGYISGVWSQRISQFLQSPKKKRLIAKVQARKRARAQLPYTYADDPKVSLVVQSFNHRDNIRRIVDRLRRTAAQELIVCEDGSVDGSEAVWRSLLNRPNDFLVQSNDLHEIRTYNRAVSFARGQFIGLLQDDDIPPERPRWLADAIALFQNDPQLAILGCWNGWRFDFEKSEGSIGSPVGRGILSDGSGLSLIDPELRLPFQYVEAVGIGPMFVRRTDFLALGGFDLRLSGPGEPGIWLDYDICLRAWSSGRRVGVYESDDFQRNIGGQGTIMFTGSKRSENFDKNLAHVRGTFADKVSSIRQTINRLNDELEPIR